jgi:stage II sporulation protein P
LVRPSHISFSPQQPTEPAEEPTAPTAPPQFSIPAFSAEDASVIQINSSFTFSADLPALMTQPLSWDLTEEEPTVLIIHSHGSESFAPTGEYEESSPYHTLDTDHNMISIGSYIAERLRAGGISVLHDTTLHDNPSYNASYNNSRASVRNYLEQHPSIRLVLDLHRDSFEDENGNQIVQSVFSQGASYAPLMIVVGTDYGGFIHPNWQENLALALKLQTQMEGLCEGICRNINLRAQRFNQDLSAGSLLIEVGASGNTKEEALRSAEILANGILSLAHGSN